MRLDARWFQLLRPQASLLARVRDLESRKETYKDSSWVGCKLCPQPDNQLGFCLSNHSYSKPPNTFAPSNHVLCPRPLCCCLHARFHCRYPQPWWWRYCQLLQHWSHSMLYVALGFLLTVCMSPSLTNCCRRLFPVFFCGRPGRGIWFLAGSCRSCCPHCRYLHSS